MLWIVLNAVQKPLLHINVAKPRRVVGFRVTCSIEAYAYFIIINIINDIIFYKYSYIFLILCFLYSLDFYWILYLTTCVKHFNFLIIMVCLFLFPWNRTWFLKSRIVIDVNLFLKIWHTVHVIFLSGNIFCDFINIIR